MEVVIEAFENKIYKLNCKLVRIIFLVENSNNELVLYEK